MVGLVRHGCRLYQSPTPAPSTAFGTVSRGSPGFCGLGHSCAWRSPSAAETFLLHSANLALLRLGHQSQSCRPRPRIRGFLAPCVVRWQVFEALGSVRTPVRKCYVLTGRSKVGLHLGFPVSRPCPCRGDLCREGRTFPASSLMCGPCPQMFTDWAFEGMTEPESQNMMMQKHEGKYFLFYQHLFTSIPVSLL